ncbi:Copper-containing nitrite reductase (modular protein) [Mesorhizobium plurifarium]|uniref:Copper-containing nitrite reductase (Modular protein) n=1 Tax=Mesorhizobium plurifarium TaxID=69974 RepID=A0A090GB29_MESPL|nr:Copper-containing nitrite reductase (modular protein) [Mesorhizobium plurifarium]
MEDRLSGLRGNRLGSFDLHHQVVVPGSIDGEVRGGAELDSLDQVVIDVGIDAGLPEGVERRARRTAADEPGLHVLGRGVRELASFPDEVAVAADQVRTGVAIGLRMDDQNRFADLGLHGGFASQRSRLAVEYDMGRDQAAHHLNGVVVVVAGRVVLLEFSLLVARDIEVILADIVDAIVADGLALLVLQAVARQDHHRAAHPRHDMPRDHRAARGAMIDERPRPGRLEAERHLLARVDQRQRAATESAGRRMEVDIVGERVGIGIDQRELEIVAFMHDHQRARDGAIVSHGIELRAVGVDDHRLLLDLHGELDDLGAALGHLIVSVHERRRHQGPFSRGSPDKSFVAAITGVEPMVATAAAVRTEPSKASRLVSILHLLDFNVSIKPR